MSFIVIAVVLAGLAWGTPARADKHFSGECGKDGAGDFVFYTKTFSDGHCASELKQNEAISDWVTCAKEKGLDMHHYKVDPKLGPLYAECFEDIYYGRYSAATSSHYESISRIPDEMRGELRKCESKHSKSYFERHACMYAATSLLDVQMRNVTIAYATGKAEGEAALQKLPADMSALLLKSCKKVPRNECIGLLTDQIAKANNSMASKWESLIVTAMLESRCEESVYMVAAQKTCEAMMTAAAELDPGFSSVDEITYHADKPPKKNKGTKGGKKNPPGGVSEDQKKDKKPFTAKEIKAATPAKKKKSPPAEGGEPSPPAKMTEAKRSAEDGLGGGKKECPVGVNCDMLSKVAITDPRGAMDGKSIYQCPEYLKDYNCLALGTGLKGDLLAAGSSDEIQNNWCMKKLVGQPTGAHEKKGMPRSGDKRQASSPKIKQKVKYKPPTAEELAPFVRARYPNAKKPACEYYFKEFRQNQDVPMLDNEENLKAAAAKQDISGVAGKELYDLLMFTADAVTNEVSKDLGVFAVRKQAMQIFLSSAYIDPPIMESPQALNTLVASLSDGADSLTSCLNQDPYKGDSKLLKSDLIDVASVWKQTAAADPAGMKGFQERWFQKHLEAARLDKALEQAAFTAETVWGDIGCFRRKHMPNLIGDMPVRKDDKTSSYASWFAYLDEDWQNEDKHKLLSTDDAKYKARVTFLTQTAGKYLDNPVSVSEMGGLSVDCRKVEAAFRDLKEERNRNLSQHPLLTQVSNSDDRAMKVSCDTGVDVHVSAMGHARPGNWYSTYGQPDPASADEVKKNRGEAPIPIDCHRDRTLSDRLVHGEGLPALLAAARTMRQKTKDNLKGICGPGKGAADLALEGKRTSCMEGMVAGFLSCKNVGKDTTDCLQRQSYGWTFCRSCTQGVMDKQWKERQEREFQMGMMLLNTALMVVPGGGLVANLVIRGINLALIGYSAHEAHEQKSSAESEEKRAYVDFQGENIGWAEYQGALAKAEAAGDNYMLWQLANVAFAGLEIHAVKGLLSEAKTAATMKRIGTVLAEGKGAGGTAKMAAGVESGIERSTDDIYHLLKSSGPDGEKLAKDYLDLIVAPALETSYGPLVRKLKDPDDMLALAKLEEELSTLGRANPAARAKVKLTRAQIGEALKDPASFATACKVVK